MLGELAANGTEPERDGIEIEGQADGGSVMSRSLVLSTLVDDAAIDDGHQ